MSEAQLSETFENQRGRLQAVAFRMLGSTAEAEDAVQETWLRLHRSDADQIDNLAGWLTTVVSRVALDMLRSRSVRREQSWPEDQPNGSGSAVAPLASSDPDHPEREAVLADAVGSALLVVLETLSPAERLAFVLHDLFAVSFDEIGQILDRSPVAARQLASRARRRVQGGRPGDRDAALAGRRRDVVDAFLAASREGRFDRLLTLLDPDAVLRPDATALLTGGVVALDGAEAVAGSFSGRAHAARIALLDGEPGLIWAHAGVVRVVFRFRFGGPDGETITSIEQVADPAVLEAMTVEPL